MGSIGSHLKHIQNISLLRSFVTSQLQIWMMITFFLLIPIFIAFSSIQAAQIDGTKGQQIVQTLARIACNAQTSAIEKAQHPADSDLSFSSNEPDINPFIKQLMKNGVYTTPPEQDKLKERWSQLAREAVLAFRSCSSSIPTTTNTSSIKPMPANTGDPYNRLYIAWKAGFNQLVNTKRQQLNDQYHLNLPEMHPICFLYDPRNNMTSDQINNAAQIYVSILCSIKEQAVKKATDPTNYQLSTNLFTKFNDQLTSYNVGQSEREYWLAFYITEINKLSYTPLLNDNTNSTFKIDIINIKWQKLAQRALQILVIEPYSANNPNFKTPTLSCLTTSTSTSTPAMEAADQKKAQSSIDNSQTIIWILIGVASGGILIAGCALICICRPAHGDDRD